MADEKYVRLITQLHDRTEIGSIPWEKTIVDGVYQVSFPKYSVRILKRNSKFEPNAVNIVVQIFNSENALIEEIADPDVAGIFVNSYLYMGQIYALARRTAEGVDTAIDSILASLDDSNEPPF